jgi:uncharacterized membrane protein AbrB (regulator of aidB expression)
MGNTRIKAAVLRGISFATFCFLLKKSRKKYYILKNFTNTVFGCCIGRKYRKRVFLEFEKEVEVHFVPMMTIFLSSIGAPQTLGIDMGWFLLLQPSFLG